ncbi:MAG: ATP-binding protein [Phycisphaeraceae bacterium]|nr:ATP-binding protein [Phycisphaeraceae bacterium]
MLDYIEIDNFRSCESVGFRLGEPVVALLGKNGAGKTNVLHAIQLAADLCVGEAELALALHLRENSKPVAFSLGFTINSHVYEYRTNQSPANSSSYVFEESLKKDNAYLFRRVGEDTHISFEGSTSVFRIGTRAVTLPALLTVLPENHSGVAELRPVADYLRSVRYYSLLRGFQEHFAGTERTTRSDRASGSSPYVELDVYEEWKADLAQGLSGRSVQLRLLHMFLEDTASFEELKTLLGENGLGLLADIRVEQVRTHVMAPSDKQEKPEDASGDAYALSFIPCAGLAGAGRAFRYSGLSSGTLRILQLLTYLIFDKHSCMLLEQPEDSIHPGLLAKVIDILRTYSERTQLICTTHSPRVMNLVGPAGIRLVTAEGGSTKVGELSGENMRAVDNYMQDEGTLAEFLDTL